MDEQKRELLKARVALDRMKTTNDAIKAIIDVLAELPDWESRKNAIEYLHYQLQRVSQPK